MPFGLMALPLYNGVWAACLRIPRLAARIASIAFACAVIGVLPAWASFVIWEGPIDGRFFSSELGRAYLVQFTVSGLVFGLGTHFKRRVQK
ncbi:hypothetical protein [Saccharibacillus alkalitolerans]|uniref:Uncharacterized protein n=1 Tax=Saccharibacillus alkalitolerans TaxID=2705290 RepID=A0ABX0FBU9_9BACL|nr:hypothetical protein [Saccharibacillus alkalitolerans]NGZ76721.1 hypothetical protein [Saccharibacillus alkalitolerans]